MNIDLVQVFINLIVGAASAWIAGKFGVRRALEQARKERAFDRSLQWHENTLRATNNLRTLHKEYRANLVDASTIFTLDRSAKVGRRLEECASELQRSLFEAVLFSPKKIVRNLRLAADEVQGIIALARKVAELKDASNLEPEWALLEKLKSIDARVTLIHVGLVHSIRKQLGLDKLTTSDLGLGPEPTRTEKLRGFALARFPFVAKLFPRMFPH
jgi:hypothetical protein